MKTLLVSLFLASLSIVKAEELRHAPFSRLLGSDDDCVKRKNGDLKSCLNKKARCWVFKAYKDNDYDCDDGIDKYLCPCKGLCDDGDIDADDENEFRKEYCKEFVSGKSDDCKDHCEDFLKKCCKYPDDCDF